MAKSKFDALLEGISGGGTAGFADEIDGAIGGAQTAIQDGSGVDGFFESYQKERDASRRSRAESAERHPVLTGVGEGIGTGLGVVAAAPLGALGVTGRGAVALGGALEGIGRSEESGFLNSGLASADGAVKALLLNKALEGGAHLVGKAGTKLKALIDNATIKPGPVLTARPKINEAALVSEKQKVGHNADAPQVLQDFLAALKKDGIGAEAELSATSIPANKATGGRYSNYLEQPPVRSEFSGSPFAPIPKLDYSKVAPEQLPSYRQASSPLDVMKTNVGVGDEDLGLTQITQSKNRPGNGPSRTSETKTANLRKK